MVEFGTFTDECDERTYKTVRIGNQTWFAENLAFDIEGVGYHIGREGDFGRLYTWHEAMSVVPNGWHLPSKAEWQELVDFCGGGRTATRNLKIKSDLDTDLYGFGAVLSWWDCRWWTSDCVDNKHAYYFLLRHSHSPPKISEYTNKMDKCYVRCVKN